MMNIESIRAKQCQSELNGRSQLRQPVAEPQKGKTVEVVGEKIGRSAEFVRQGLPVLKAIDSLKETGHARAAENLRIALNANVKKAYQSAQNEGYIASAPITTKPDPKPEPKSANYITLDQWNGYSPVG